MDQKELEQKYLNWDAVHAWVQSQPPERKIGKPRMNAYDPFGTYLQEQLGGYWTIGPSIIHMHVNGETRYLIPSWMDSAMEVMDKELEETVTVAQFAAIVERVKPRTD